tara:strand:- start:278 stop:577 length:300 start_codon:yes stop_codon:yes gene_type:complete
MLVQKHTEVDSTVFMVKELTVFKISLKDSIFTFDTHGDYKIIDYEWFDKNTDTWFIAAKNESGQIIGAYMNNVTSSRNHIILDQVNEYGYRVWNRYYLK